MCIHYNLSLRPLPTVLIGEHPLSTPLPVCLSFSGLSARIQPRIWQRIAHAPRFASTHTPFSSVSRKLKLNNLSSCVLCSPPTSNLLNHEPSSLKPDAHISTSLRLHAQRALEVQLVLVRDTVVDTRMPTKTLMARTVTPKQATSDKPFEQHVVPAEVRGGVVAASHGMHPGHALGGLP